MDNAAADINIVRGRANAELIASADVDIDFILDERIRELGTEELRQLTLRRLGLLYDRVSRYAKPTGFNGNDQTMVDGFGVQPHHNLWPIPFSEIERNTDAVLEQNPDYAAEQ
ncbi:MAG: RagB/SusD family nutrient uptake outer membrane protein [Cyclobacteriaceae bacterium]